MSVSKAVLYRLLAKPLAPGASAARFISASLALRAGSLAASRPKRISGVPPGLPRSAVPPVAGTVLAGAACPVVAEDLLSAPELLPPRTLRKFSLAFLALISSAAFSRIEAIAGRPSVVFDLYEKPWSPVRTGLAATLGLSTTFLAIGLLAVVEIPDLGAVSAGRLSVTFASGASVVTAFGAPYLRVFVRLLSARRSAARVAVRSAPVRLAKSSLASAMRCWRFASATSASLPVLRAAAFL